MIKLARIIYVISAWLFFVGVVLQVFLAGVSLFVPSGSWVTHVQFGYLVGFLVPILIVLAFLGRMPRATKIQMTIVIVLYLVQITLPILRGSAPIIAALHPVNALVLFGLAWGHARRAQAFTRDSGSRAG